MLLDIGPREDGTIDWRQEVVLLELGRWIKENEEAVYQTTAGIDTKYYRGGSVLSQDMKTLYVFVRQRPKGDICIKGLRTKINKISVLHTGEIRGYVIHGGVPWFDIPGEVWINIDGINENKYTTVMKVELADKIELYDGNGIVVTDN